VSEGSQPEGSLTRHEEELEVEKSSEQIGAVRARKKVETEKVEQRVPRDVEDADVERIPAGGEEDSGEIETLPDGSISIPLFEEQLVVTKRLVVRERIIIRKRTTTEIERIEATLRAEQIEIEEDPG
jgi:uncharacterized protein (TIGR02271 family)